MRQRARPAAAFGRCQRQKEVPSPVPPSSPKPAHRKDRRHCPRGCRLCPKIFDNAQRKWLRHVFRYCLPRNRKASQGMPQAWPCFFIWPPQVGMLFHYSREVIKRRPASAASLTERGLRASQRSPLPTHNPLFPAARHERYRRHHRPRPLSPGPAPAAGQLPFRRGRPAAGGLRGGKPRLPAGNGAPAGGGTGQRLRSGPAGPVPASAVRHDEDGRAQPSGGTAPPSVPRCAACRAAVRDCLQAADGGIPSGKKRTAPARPGPGAGRGPVRCGHSKRPPSGAGRCMPFPAGRPCRHAFFAGLRRKCLPSRPGQPALCPGGQRPPLGQCPA